MKTFWKYPLLLHLCLLFAFLLIASSAQAQMTYSLHSSAQNSPRIEEIRAAMDEAVAEYNRLSTYNVRVEVRYDASVPTANGSYLNNITFGGQIGARTAVHEIAHYLGIGTYNQWGNNRNGNVWTGQFGIAKLREFDGEGAVLNADRFHFWPYGLNFDREDGEENRRRHVEMVGAMRQDMGLVNGTNGTGPTTIENGGVYALRNVRSGKMIDVSGNDNRDGAPLVSWPGNGGNKQQWRMVSTSDGYYQLVNVRNNKSMDVEGNSQENNARIIQWGNHGRNNQQWKPIQVADGRYAFQSRSSGKCLDLAGGNTENGSPYIQWTCEPSNQNQLFDLVPAIDASQAQTESFAQTTQKATDCSVDKQSLREALVAYPNPSVNGTFRLSADVETWEVFSLEGSSVLVGKGSTLDLSPFPRGMYLLKTGDNQPVKLVYE